MRGPVVSSKDAARAVHDALTRRIRHRHAIGFNAQQHVTAVAASNGFLYIGTDNGLVRAAERELPVQ